MSFHPKVRDPQNPYRTGVLISNHVEDRFGQDLASMNRQGTTGITEQQAKHTMNSTLIAVNEGKQIPTQQEILDDKEYKDYYKHLVDCKVGTQKHLLFGHGSTQEAFENRDMGTVNNSVYDKLEK